MFHVAIEKKKYLKNKKKKNMLVINRQTKRKKNITRDPNNMLTSFGSQIESLRACGCGSGVAGIIGHGGGAGRHGSISNQTKVNLK